MKCAVSVSVGVAVGVNAHGGADRDGQDIRLVETRPTRNMWRKISYSPLEVAESVSSAGGEVKPRLSCCWIISGIEGVFAAVAAYGSTPAAHYSSVEAHNCVAAHIVDIAAEV